MGSWTVLDAEPTTQRQGLGDVAPYAADEHAPGCEIVVEDDHVRIFTWRQAAFAVVYAENSGWGEGGHAHRLGQGDAHLLKKDCDHTIDEGGAARKGGAVEHHAHAVVHLVPHLAHAEARALGQARAAGRVGDDAQPVGADALVG